MNNLWDDAAAQAFPDDLGQRVYTSRLLGQDKSLVMHGGGNTSVKIRQTNLFGNAEEVLYVKGSGWDLATIEVAGFTGLRLAPVRELATLDSLTDTQMANELICARIDATAPAPSVEAILHAILPEQYVDHTHADAVIAVTNSRNGRSRIEEIYGDCVVVVPYVMPGFKLARMVAEIFPEQANEHTIGIVLLNHGIFSFGQSAKQAYERMIDLVSRAEDYLKRKQAWQITFSDVQHTARPIRAELAALRKAISSVAGFPAILSTHSDAQSLSFARRSDVAELSQQGPLTPDHVIYTKRVPMIGRDVDDFARAYEAYFAEHQDAVARKLTMLDQAPRVVLDPEYGMITVGRSAKDSRIVEDLYRHTMDTILRSTALGGYEALPPRDIFEVEYWELEQAKLLSRGKPPQFAGEIALVTGAASGIGKACVSALMARGAAVVALDINPQIETMIDHPGFLGAHCDVTDEQAVADTLERAVRKFGGLDMLILNAGIFPPSAPIEAIPLAQWDQVMRINLDANLLLMSEAYPLLKNAPRGGRVVIVGSKNVPAPGPGAAAYSASKAALNQLGRVAALEWGSDNIRVNMVHPNAVFDTAIWSDEVLEKRAHHYGLTVEQYKTNNLLKVEVTSRDVAELVAEMCGTVFARTTGAQIPIDGGNDRVI